MPTDIPAHAPFTGEPGGAPEYAPGETTPEYAPDSPEELPDQTPFENDGGAAEPGVSPQFPPTDRGPS